LIHVYVFIREGVKKTSSSFQVAGSMGLWLGLGVLQILQLFVSTLAKVRKICKLRKDPQI